MKVLDRTSSYKTTRKCHLQNNLNIIGVAFALLITPEPGAAVQERGGRPRLVGVDRCRGIKRARGWAGRGSGSAALCSDRHCERESVPVSHRHELSD